MRAGDLDPAFAEQTLTAERRAGHEAGFVAERELCDVQRDESRQRPSPDRARGRWPLRRSVLAAAIARECRESRDRDSTPRRARAIGLGRLGGQFELHRMQPELAAHLVFRAHVGPRSGIIADEDDGEARGWSALLQLRPRFRRADQRKPFRRSRGLRSVDSFHCSTQLHHRISAAAAVHAQIPRRSVSCSRSR